MPVWLNLRVGWEGAACFPRLSWVIFFAAVGLLPDCREARGAPGRHAPTVRQGCPARATSLKLEVDLFCPGCRVTVWPRLLQQAFPLPKPQPRG